MTMSNILPCPFCGRPPETQSAGEGGRGLMIDCITPGCVNPHVSYYDHVAARTVWNRRATVEQSASGEVK